MGLIKSLFGKKESSCCDIKIEEAKAEDQQEKQHCCSTKIVEVKKENIQ